MADPVMPKLVARTDDTWLLLPRDTAVASPEVWAREAAGEALRRAGLRVTDRGVAGLVPYFAKLAADFATETDAAALFLLPPGSEPTVRARATLGFFSAPGPEAAPGEPAAQAALLLPARDWLTEEPVVEDVATAAGTAVRVITRFADPSAAAARVYESTRHLWWFPASQASALLSISFGDPAEGERWRHQVSALAETMRRSDATGPDSLAVGRTAATAVEG